MFWRIQQHSIHVHTSETFESHESHPEQTSIIHSVITNLQDLTRLTGNSIHIQLLDDTAGPRRTANHQHTSSNVLCSSRAQQHITAQHGTARHSTAQHDTARHSTATAQQQHSAADHTLRISNIC
jgi:hypothetical protein